MVSHDEISKLWEGAIMENHSLYNLIAKMGKVLSVDTRIELVIKVIVIPERLNSSSDNMTGAI